MRWVPAVLEAVGMHGILVLVWISGWMVALRLLASHFVERLAPTGMLLAAAVLTSTGLFLLSFVQGLWSALAVATIFAWGIAFFFPTMVGLVSERLPRTGSLGIVLTAGVGLGMAGAVGVPLIGSLADRFLAGALDPARAMAVLERVEQRFPDHLAAAARGETAVDASDISAALTATRTALATLRQTRQVQGDATATALRAVVATRLPDPVVAEANALLQLAEARGARAGGGVRHDVPERSAARRVPR